MQATLVASLFFSVLLPSVSGDTGLKEGQDLHSFVTRPDLKPPKWKVTYHNKSEIAPGYWFVAPYSRFGSHLEDVKWQSCQCGPTIYDNEGELVWSGACKWPNHVVWDFKVSQWWDGSSVLTGVMDNADFQGEDVGAGWFLGEDYKSIHSIAIAEHGSYFDKHEFNTLKDSTTVLITQSDAIRAPAPELGLGRIHMRKNSFKEIDVETGEVLFDWVVNDHVSLIESTWMITRKAFRKTGLAWDPFHVNSVDKNDDGDYLVSLRHADMILLVSGKTGDIKWRAGGILSDFVMEGGLAWSRQHHPRFIKSTKNKTVISLMDNAIAGQHGGGQEPTHEFSRGLIIQLNHPEGMPTTAKILRHFDRPDGGYTEKRGNVQMLPNGNVFVAWTDAAYFTEFSADGTPLMEARWLNDERFGTYRAYKYDNWVGRPDERPQLVSLASGSEDVFLTTMYVSWNGATEVAMYDFWEEGEEPSEDVLLGRVNKTGFETAFVTQGHTGRVRVDALDANGYVLRESRWTHTKVPDGWKPDSARLPDSESNEKLGWDDDEDEVDDYEKADEHKKIHGDGKATEDEEITQDEEIVDDQKTNDDKEVNGDEEEEGEEEEKEEVNDDETNDEEANHDKGASKVSKPGRPGKPYKPIKPSKPSNEDPVQWKQYVDAAAQKPWLVGAVTLNVILILVIIFNFFRRRKDGKSWMARWGSRESSAEYEPLKDEEES